MPGEDSDKTATGYVDDIISEIVELSKIISKRESSLSSYGEMLLIMSLLRVRSDIRYINKCVKHKDMFYNEEYPW